MDGHSFHPTPLPHEPAQDPRRPDFCIGTDPFHTPPALTELCVAFLTAKGYRVSIDTPFSGSITPLAYYQRERRVSSLMLEVNRRLYVEVPGALPALRRLIGRLLTRLEAEFWRL